MEIPEYLLEELRLESDRETHSGPGFNPMEDSGGNFDDAYSMGVEDGRIRMAREILKKLEEFELA